MRVSVLRSTVPRLRGGYLAEVSSGCDLPIDSLVGSEVTASSRLGQPVVYNILLSFSVEVGFSLFQHIHPPPPNHNYIPNIIRLKTQFFPGYFYLGILAVLSLAVYLEWLVLIVGLFVGQTAHIKIRHHLLSVLAFPFIVIIIVCQLGKYF